MFSKKDFTFIVFFFFVARIKFIRGNLENNEMYHSQILIYWQLCWRESHHWKRKEKLRIELRFKELWNKSIRLFCFTTWLKSFWWVLEILLRFFMNHVSSYFSWLGRFVMELFRAFFRVSKNHEFLKVSQITLKKIGHNL
jgi:hypothetical protein